MPFTVYYYKVNNLVMSDSPFWLKGLFEASVRSYDYISYSYDRSGFDNLLDRLSDKEKERVGEPLQAFYIYMDR